MCFRRHKWSSSNCALKAIERCQELGKLVCAVADLFTQFVSMGPVGLQLLQVSRHVFLQLLRVLGQVAVQLHGGGDKPLLQPTISSLETVKDRCGVRFVLLVFSLSFQVLVYPHTSLLHIWPVSTVDLQ